MSRLSMKAMRVGMRVVTKKDGLAYQKGEDRETIPAGSEGVVGAVDVPCVRHKKGNPTAFVCVDFPSGDRAAYFVRDIKLAK